MRSRDLSGPKSPVSPDPEGNWRRRHADRCAVRDTKHADGNGDCPRDPPSARARDREHVSRVRHGV